MIYLACQGIILKNIVFFLNLPLFPYILDTPTPEKRGYIHEYHGKDEDGHHTVL